MGKGGSRELLKENHNRMKAMIFAAGLGTRLKPLTDSCPKALVEVGGRPMLEHLIHKLKAAGVDHIVMNIHHLGQQIIDFLKAHENFGVRIDLSDERGELLDTGGGIKKACPFLEGREPFLVHNVDVASDLDLKAFWKEHCASGALASLLLGQRNTTRYLLFDEQNCLKGWKNCQTGEFKFCDKDVRATDYRSFAFNGIHVLSPEIFQRMKDWEGKFSIIDFYLSIAADTNIRGCYKPAVKWMDMGKPEALEKAASLFEEEWKK